MFNFPDQDNSKHNDSITTLILTLTAALMTWVVCSSCCFHRYSAHFTVVWSAGVMGGWSVGVMWPRPGLHTNWAETGGDCNAATRPAHPHHQHQQSGAGTVGSGGFRKIWRNEWLVDRWSSLSALLMSCPHSDQSLVFTLQITGQSACLMFVWWCGGHLNEHGPEFPDRFCYYFSWSDGQ